MELEELFNTPRMGHAPLDNVNSVRGLYEIVRAFYRPHFKVAEIGSFEGVSTILFSKFVDTVYSIDCYDYVVPETGRIPSHDETFVRGEKTFLERTKDIKNIVKIRKTSVEAAKDFADRSLDAVYIDAEHDENSVRQDVQAWKGKIKFGGYLSGHDYYLPHIEKILVEEGFKDITIAPDSSWIVKIPSVTLVAVACTKVPETLEAMHKCLKQMDFNGATLFTDADVKDESIDVVKIEKLDYKGYNEFVAMKLWGFVDADFALVVQNDSWILNSAKWENSWFNYDYIGSAWPIPPDEDKITYRTPSGRLVRVGNGGFSLRSRKLLRAPTILGLEFTDGGSGFYHEDGNLCVHHGDTLIKHGIKFAPVEVAVKFARELEVPELIDKDTFGFHKYL